MRNYDFHQLLSYEEFQRFASDIISIRENKKIRFNSMTHDGGIDFYDLDNTIIGQVKNYQDNFQSLQNSLKKEIERVNNIKPQRYILVTSTPCSKKQKETLITMFNGYLQYEDILDKHELNILLENPKYHNLEIEYLKLLVPNSFVLAHFLEQIEYKNIYTQTEIELDKIKKEQKVFSKLETYDQALDKLLKERTIIISGEPGIGKSILGRMLIANIINTNPKIQFISVKTIDELYQIYNKDTSQVYFFDDFFGDIKYNFQIDTIKQKKILDFINYLKESNDKYLILTTREYIFKDGLNLNKNNQDKFNKYKLNLKLEEISKVSKFNILYNHIRKINLSWDHLKVITDYWEYIVNNDNYTPRLAETFLNNYDNYKDLSDIKFINKFIDYLNKPFENWKEILKEQPFELIILLIIIALNNEKTNINILHNKFNYLINSKNIEKDIHLSFEDYIKKMEDTFAITNIHEDKLYIEFKNPSYKDFILDYFSKNVSIYLSYVYNEKTSLHEMINIWEVINKNYELYKDLKETPKIDTNILLNITDEPQEEYLRHIITLAKTTDFKYETKIKKLIIAKTIELLQNSEDLIYDDYNSYNTIFPLLESLKGKYDLTPYIFELLLTITFDSNNIYDFERITIVKELYPEIYKAFYKEYKKEIKDQIYNIAISDALFYKEDKDMFSIDILKYEDLPRIHKELNIQISKKLKTELEEIEQETYELTKDTTSDNKVSNVKNYKKENESQEDLSIINDKITKLTGEKNYIYNLEEFFKNNKTSVKIRKIIKELLEKHTEILTPFIKNKQTLLLLCSYLKDNEISLSLPTLLENFTDYLLNKNNLHEEEFKYICNIAFFMIKDNKIIFTKEDVENIRIMPVQNIDKVVNNDFFIKRGNFYHFINPIFQLYLVLSQVKKYDFNINIIQTINFTSNYEENWEKIDFYNYNTISKYKLLSLFFEEEWTNLVHKELINFIITINTKDDISIAKSILKYFNIKISYDNGWNEINNYNNFLHDIIMMYTDDSIIDLLCVEPLYHTDELVDFYERFPGTTEDNVLIINKYLNNKKFINLLLENNIIEEINDIYNKLLKIYHFIEESKEKVTM